MKAIYKYKLEIKDKQTIEMPPVDFILHLGEQDGELYIWVMVDLEIPKLIPMEFKILGTGQPTKDPDLGLLSYIGSVQMKSGLVWHVFETTDRKDWD
jgi:hypothetical protein